MLNNRMWDNTEYTDLSHPKTVTGVELLLFTLVPHFFMTSPVGWTKHQKLMSYNFVIFPAQRTLCLVCLVASSRPDGLYWELFKGNRSSVLCMGEIDLL